MKIEFGYRICPICLGENISGIYNIENEEGGFCEDCKLILKVKKIVRPMKTFIFTFTNPFDSKSIKKSLENKGAYFVSEIELPFWNVYGQILKTQYAIIYQHHKKLDFEVRC